MDKALCEAMLQADFYPHATDNIRLIETHISSVFLTGEYAYKVKKAVNFGFLDFSDLTRRQFYCEEELRLNRRLAPDLYLQLVPIYQHQDGYSLQATNDASPIEYAVKMRQFDPQNQLDCLLARQQLSIEHMEELAMQISNFHQIAAIADDTLPWGEQTDVTKPCFDNFPIIEKILHDDSDAMQQLAELNTWTSQQQAHLADTFKQRKQQQKIRECHGDMHLGNIAVVNGKITLFDCIEFNETFRWVDVISDLAFLLMDLQYNGRADFAHRLLNAYLTQAGDYDGLEVLQFYLVYRALVRAKIASLQNNKAVCLAYVQLAKRYTQQQAPILAITYGVSGSGKSWGSRKICDEKGWIHLRSDVERKRIAGVSLTDRNAEDKLYESGMSRKTYDQLHQFAATAIKAGYSVIVDATFLKQADRQRFQDLAEQLACDYQILHFTASLERLEQNIRQRQQRNDDPSDATVEVMYQQREQWLEPLIKDERQFEQHFEQ